MESSQKGSKLSKSDSNIDDGLQEHVTEEFVNVHVIARVVPQAFARLFPFKLLND